jgi:two-component system cell cycle response regulator DivK
VGPLILVVDDTRDTRELFVEYLRLAGFEAEQAESGTEALHKAAALRPAAIVMDLEMPEMDGWEATRRLKADPTTATIPIIALTASAFESDREKSMAAGCCDFDTKPVDLPRLLGKIEKSLLAARPETV